MTPIGQSGVRFASSVDFMSPPPGGFEFGIGDDVVGGRNAAEIMPKVRALLAKHGVGTDPELALAEYMCPRMGPESRRYCRGAVPAPDYVLPREALANCAPLAPRPMVPFDTVQRRLGVCSSCPRHERHWCLTCTGAFDEIKRMMRGRRPLLPADRFSGVCGCARAYEAVVCSIDYDGEAPWPDAPETCWRRRNDV